MQYQTFLTQVQTQLSFRLQDIGNFSVRSILKNNSLRLDALCLNSPRAALFPTVYLNEYYQMLCDGKSMADILDELTAIFRNYQTSPLPFSNVPFTLETIRTHIVYKLIHTGMNQELLKKIPYVPYLDLSIVFYLYMENSEGTPMSALVHTIHQELWGYSTEELFSMAKENTPRLLPPVLASMEQVLANIISEHTETLSDSKKLCSADASALPDMFPDLPALPDEEPHPPMYVLSNPPSFFGASCILYPDVLKKFAEQSESDLILLPSSIHEFLILPFDESIRLKELNETVSTINETSVPLEDRLSDHIYYYLREKDEIIIPPFVS